MPGAVKESKKFQQGLDGEVSRLSSRDFSALLVTCQWPCRYQNEGSELTMIEHNTMTSDASNSFEGLKLVSPLLSRWVMPTT